MTLIKLNRKEFKALVDALGYADAIRFIRQFDNSSGDYTKERHQWSDNLSLDVYFLKCESTKKLTVGTTLKRLLNSVYSENQKSLFLNP